MKIKLILILIASVFVIACSQDEYPLTNSANQVNKVDNMNPIPISGNDNSTTQNRSSGCSTWEPPVAPLGTSGTVYHITYSQNPTDYPGNVVDIECTRMEFFDRFCALRMTLLQDQDPFKDAWISVTPLPFGCAPTFKDDVETATNEDPRVCVGTDCD